MEGAHFGTRKSKVAEKKAVYDFLSTDELVKRISLLEKQMYAHAKNMEFEQAAQVRDAVLALQAQLDRS